MKTFISEVWRIIQAKPSCHKDFEGLEEFSRAEEESCLRLNLIVSLQRSHITAVIGEWGAGKTIFVRQWKRQFESLPGKKPKIEELNFFGIGSYNEALFHLTTPFQRVVSALLFGSFSAGLYWAYSRFFPESQSLRFGFQMILIAAGVMFFVNRAMWLYVSACFINKITTLFSDSRRVFILEDLDRAAMSEEERWRFLGTLWSQDVHYIVVYGYSTGDEQVKLFEKLSKLEATIVHLPIAEGPNFHIAKQICADFPFKSAPWITLFTGRELARICRDAERDITIGAPPSRRRIELLKMFHLSVVKKLSPGLPDPARFAIVIDAQGRLSFSVNEGFSSPGPVAMNLGATFADSILKNKIFADIKTIGGPEDDNLRFVVHNFNDILRDSLQGGILRSRLR